MRNFSDGFEVMPEINTIKGNYSTTKVHPIASQIADQISQDITISLKLIGSAEEMQELDTPIKYLLAWIQESIYTSVLNGSAYLLLDFGDDEDPRTEYTGSDFPSGLQVLTKVPVIKGTMDQYHPSRYLRFGSPYRFSLAAVLGSELEMHDRISEGITRSIETPAIVTVGIQGLWEKLKRGGNAIANLTERLTRIKSGVRSGGIIAYSDPEETIGIQSLRYAREHEALASIEKRVAAITGIPNFLIWGTVDGDSFGVNSALKLYEQRIISISNRYIVPLISNLLARYTESLQVTTEGIYPENAIDTAERLSKTVSALGDLVTLRSITAIELRDTVAAMFTLVLEEDPKVTTEETDG